jgi:RND family efflux transporter MFP subunit
MSKGLSQAPAPIRRHLISAGAIVGALIGLMAIGYATIHAAPAPANSDVGASILPVSTLRIQLAETYEARRGFIGRMEAARESAIGFELGGLLRAVLVDEGEEVTAGQLLARLDRARLQARRRELQAALEEARAMLSLARITVKRLEGVLDSGGVSRQGLDEAREEYRTARAAVAVASSRIETVDVDLAKSDLYAPFPAIITKRLSDEGEVLAAGAPVLELQEHTRPEIRVGVAGRIVDAISAGDVRQIQVRGHSIPARVRAVLPVRHARTRTVDVIMTLDQHPPDVRAGDLVTLLLTQTETVPEKGFWLPIGALAEGTRGLWTAYVLERTDHGPQPTPVPAQAYRIEPRFVDIIHEESDRVFVSGAVEEGARIVADGLHRVVPGQLVRLDSAAEPPIADGDGHYAAN